MLTVEHAEKMERMCVTSTFQLSETMILEPLPEEMPEKDKSAHRKYWGKVGKALNDMKCKIQKN